MPVATDVYHGELAVFLLPGILVGLAAFGYKYGLSSILKTGVHDPAPH